MDQDDLDLLEDLLEEEGVEPLVDSAAIEPLHAADAPASFQQRRLWFLHELEPDSAAYNIATALRLDGSLDHSAFNAAVDATVRRHEILRTVFENRDGEPWQKVLPPGPTDLVLDDWRTRPSAEQEEALGPLIKLESRARFDLATGPLFRIRLVRLAEQDHVLLLTMHHIIADGWSLGIFVGEVMRFYQGILSATAAPLPDLRVQYTDYAAWQRKTLDATRFEEQFRYWETQLQDLPTLNLPTDFRRPRVQTFNGDVLTFQVPRDIARVLRSLGREGSTPFMMLAAAFVVLLARYTRQRDIVIGTSIAHRDDRDTQALIGFFVNMLVLRVDLSGDPTFREVLARVRKVVLDGFDHADLPYETLVERLQQSAARFDLEVFVQEGADGLDGVFNYNTDLFARETIVRLSRHFTTLLSSIALDPDRPVSRLTLLDEKEARALITHDRKRIEVTDTIHARFARQAAMHARRTALRLGSRAMSYAELDARANVVAHRLVEMGVGPDTLVGLWMERSLELVVGLVAILKAGGAYVPLDPAYPKDRIAFMIEDSRVAVIVTTAALGSGLPQHDARVLLVDAVSHDVARLSVEAPHVTVHPENAAYVIYTSGSTGRPKGVVVTHANVVRLMDATHPWFNFNESDVWTLFHSYAFDFSVWELWGALFYGGSVIVIPYDVSRSPDDFYNLLCDEGVTVLNQTPSAFRQLIQAEKALAREGEVALRYVIFGGEALDLASLEPWIDRHGDESPRLINMYGITETTVHVTYRPIRLADVNPLARDGSTGPGTLPDDCQAASWSFRAAPTIRSRSAASGSSFPRSKQCWPKAMPSSRCSSPSAKIGPATSGWSRMSLPAQEQGRSTSRNG